MNNKYLLVGVVLVALSCKGGPAEEEKPTPTPTPIEIRDTEVLSGLMNKCDFETRVIEFTSKSGGPSFDICQNPVKTGFNKSANCGKVVTAGGKTEFIYCTKLNKTFEFTANPPIFKMRVISPRAGAKVGMKLEAASDFPNPPAAVQVNTATKSSGTWEWLTFDFSNKKPQNNAYQKIVLLFDVQEETTGDIWYFDDIYIPDDDISDMCLFKRYKANPVFAPSGPASWRNVHMANAGILSPDKSPDGRWWCYLRGSGDIPYYCDQIGLYTQDAATFSPYGPWVEYPKNPVLPVGPEGSFDDGFLLGTSPVVGKDGVVYVYYNGKKKDRTSHGVCVRYSTDGGYTFKSIDHRLYEEHGCSDAVYHDGKYYVYHAGGDICELYVTVTEDPLDFSKGITTKTIPIGGGPDGFDTKAINGSLIFRLKGIDKWFSTYQGSSSKYDFPERFHMAVSDDLIHWKKIDNSKPMFSRGKPGTWDQGGIWFGEIIEHRDSLYLFYEGWGCGITVPDRDEKYFSPGRSSVGVAVASTKDFLDWCGDAVK